MLRQRGDPYEGHLTSSCASPYYLSLSSFNYETVPADWCRKIQFES